MKNYSESMLESMSNGVITLNEDERIVTCNAASLRIREVDRVQVKGKTQNVEVYEVLDYYTEETYPNLMEVVNHFRDGLALYRRREWDRAVARFEEALRVNPDEKFCRMYIERCVCFREEPPGDDWDGGWIMKTK